MASTHVLLAASIQVDRRAQPRTLIRRQLAGSDSDLVLPGKVEADDVDVLRYLETFGAMSPFYTLDGQEKEGE